MQPVTLTWVLFVCVHKTNRVTIMAMAHAINGAVIVWCVSDCASRLWVTYVQVQEQRRWTLEPYRQRNTPTSMYATVAFCSGMIEKISHASNSPWQVCCVWINKTAQKWYEALCWWPSWAHREKEKTLFIHRVLALPSSVWKRRLHDKRGQVRNIKVWSRWNYCSTNNIFFIIIFD